MSQVIELTLDDEGHIIIPPSSQALLGISPGTRLVVEKGNNGGLQLRPLSQPSVIVEKRGLKVARAEPLTDLTHITRFERECRVTELLERVGLS